MQPSCSSNHNEKEFYTRLMNVDLFTISGAFNLPMSMGISTIDQINPSCASTEAISSNKRRNAQSRWETKKSKNTNRLRRQLSQLSGAEERNQSRRGKTGKRGDKQRKIINNQEVIALNGTQSYNQSSINSFPLLYSELFIEKSPSQEEMYVCQLQQMPEQQKKEPEDLYLTNIIERLQQMELQ